MSRILGLLAVALFAVPMGAQAQTFDLNFAGSGESGNVVLTGTSVGGGDYFITSASGTVNGESVSLLTTATPCTVALCGATAFKGFTLFSYSYSSAPPQGWAYDDIFYTGAAAKVNGGPLDASGLGLLIAGDSINICQCGGPGAFSYADQITYPVGGNSANAYVPITVPEPATLSLLGLGLAGLGFMRRRGKN